jgi:two-component system, cell cycle response regulator DivK
LCSGGPLAALLPKKKLAMLGDTSDPAPKTVLVVEDNELNLKLLNDLLEYQGYRVITTRLGEPALGLARQYKPDLILMDIQLPDISGMEATQRLKSDEETRDIPIIAVTAFAMSGDEARILASGCDGYIAKPFNVADFLRIVAHWTARP